MRELPRPARCLAAGALVAAVSLGGCAAGSTGTGATATARQVADLLITGGTVVTMDSQRTVLRDGAVAVRDGEIVAVGPAPEVRRAWSATETLAAAPDDLVIPGLVNGHNHAAMTLLRGIADDLALMEWLESTIFPAEAQTVSPEFVRVGTWLAVLEMIRTGTTMFADMYYFEEEVAKVVDESGMRAIVGETVIGFPVPDHPTPQAALDWIGGFIERWRDHPRVTPAPAPHAPYTVEPEVLRRTAALAREHGVPILIHLAETEDEVRQIRERYGLSPTRHLEALGFLGPDVVGAHGVWLDDDDIAILARRGVGLVHNPESNMKLASGTMRVPDLRAAGVHVGLGTDGAASNNDLDMFDALMLAPFLQKHMRGDPTALPAADVLAMATIDGARALGMADRIGSLEVGKRADVVVVGGDAAHLVPAYDPYSRLAYAADGRDVRATVVEGAVLFLDGEFRTLDPERIREAARAMAGSILSALRRGDRDGDGSSPRWESAEEPS